MLSKILFYFFSLVLVSCNDGQSIDVKDSIVSQSTISAKITPPVAAKQKPTGRSKNSYLGLTGDTAVEVLSANKMVDTTSKFLKLYQMKCANWNLERKDILDIFLTSNEIDGQEFHHYYDVLPCYYSGEIHINGRIASYKLNAGAFMILFFKDTSVYLGYKRDDYKKYFLTGAGVE